MCVSLIQEQAARSAALAMGLQKEVIEMDVVVIKRRRSRFGLLTYHFHFQNTIFECVFIEFIASHI
jgi:hypothetical protein